jgi:hypothetical protein
MLGIFTAWQFLPVWRGAAHSAIFATTTSRHITDWGLIEWHTA